MSSCLITGASGFGGRPLLEALVEAGYACRTLQRSGSSSVGGEVQHYVANLGVDPIPEDSLAGVETVIHLAGTAHTDYSGEEHDRVHRAGTLQLAAAAAEAGVQHFIYMSSVKAMGESDGDGLRIEASIAADASPYGQAKRAAELGLADIAAASNMGVTVLRPALVYGFEAKGNLATLLRYSIKPLPGLPRLGARSMVALEDLLAAVSLFVGRPLPGYRCYIVSGADAYSSRDIQELSRHALGRPAPSVTVPSWMCRAILAAVDVIRHKEGASTFQRVFGAELFSSAALQADTEWRPMRNLESYLPTMLAAVAERENAHA